MTPAPDHDRAALVAIGVLGVSNVVSNRLLPTGGYVPWNLGVTVALARLARAAGVDATELGLDPARWRRGATVGATAVGGTALAYLAALGRADAGTLRDRRVTDLRPAEAWYEALVRVPLGTVVLEEFAFRGLLPALLRRRASRRWVPWLVPAVLFGLWHVLPSRELTQDNDAVAALAGRVGGTGARTAAVAATAVAGGALHALARVGGHLVAPVAAHWASNALGVLAARLAVRRADVCSARPSASPPAEKVS